MCIRGDIDKIAPSRSMRLSDVVVVVCAVGTVHVIWMSHIMMVPSCAIPFQLL